MIKENIVVMTLQSNECYPKIITLEEAKKNYPEDFVFDDYSEEWYWIPYGSNSRYVTQMIGQGYYSRINGVLGVFDKTNIDHLNTMAHMCISSVKLPASCDAE